MPKLAARINDHLYEGAKMITASVRALIDQGDYAGAILEAMHRVSGHYNDEIVHNERIAVSEVCAAIRSAQPSAPLERQKLPYEEIDRLSRELARWNARRQLLEMFVEPATADQRVTANEKAGTQDWLREKAAMFDALVALGDLGYVVSKAPDQPSRTA
jgi:hypothetical protein